MSIASKAGEFIGQFIGSAYAQYDSLNPTFFHHRRRPIRELGTQEDYSLRQLDRDQAIANGRDLHQNYAPVRSILRSFKTQIYGCGPKLHLKTSDETWNQTAAWWFNHVWAKKEHCDAAQRWTLTDQNKLSLIARYREGDVLCWFDFFGAADPTRKGCLYWFEADRLCSMNSALWTRFVQGDYAIKPHELDPTVSPSDLMQTQGVIKHARSGRHIAYVVSSKYMQMEVGASDKFSILPAKWATLIAHPFRISDTRGTPDLLSCHADFADGREIKENLKLRVKNQSALAMVVKRAAAIRGALSRRSSTTQPDLTSADAHYSSYDTLEEIFNGRVEYIGENDEVQAFQLSGDAGDILDLLNRNDAWCSAALGVPDQYSRMQADASYSAARAITNMAMDEFAVQQDFEENHLLDWQAKMALNFAMKTGAIPPGPEKWDELFVWLAWPEPKAIDALKEAMATEKYLTMGLKNYADLIGPEWERHFEQRAKEKQFVLSKSLMIDGVYGDLPQKQVRQ